MNIKNFKEFNLKENKDDEYTNLSSDIELLKKDDNGESEKLDLEEWEVVKIVDIIKDDEEIEVLEANIGLNLTADLDAKNLKRGDYIYMTALLAPRNKSTAYSPGTMGVLKCRITDIYQGLSKLKSLMK